jgi:hypothetical protein
MTIAALRHYVPRPEMWSTSAHIALILGALLTVTAHRWWPWVRETRKIARMYRLDGAGWWRAHRMAVRR